MRVVLKSNFDMAGVFSRGVIEVDTGTRLGALLELLSEKCRVDWVDAASGRARAPDYGITLNGKEAAFWPDGLHTVLNDDDEVEIVVLPLGGG